MTTTYQISKNELLHLRFVLEHAKFENDFETFKNHAKDEGWDFSEDKFESGLDTLLSFEFSSTHDLPAYLQIETKRAGE